MFLSSYHLHLASFYSLSLHDALPISSRCFDDFGLRRLFQLLLQNFELFRLRALFVERVERVTARDQAVARPGGAIAEDRKSTRLNSSHLGISYAVFCLKKKNTKHN